ncbi:aminotransferase class III-fold pyridoxal phosphate-dependent enzyme [Robiginitalea sp. IMCC43444]|uniref:aminotransferase class III-fold pyridoxal phosphate-dependent enzyme n=1 Tax=Robiginitalea sp. IMCC43444 TaxID=3459121 RepID=UPI0040411C76
MESLKKYLSRHYGLYNPELQLLEGYADKTYKVITGEGCWILKVHPERPGLAKQISAEHNYMEALDKLKLFKVPAHVKSKENKVFIAAENKVLRLLRFVPGQFMSEINWPATFLDNFGSFLAEVSKVGLELDPSDIAAKRFHWDLQHLLMNKEYLKSVSEPGIRSQIDYFFLQFELEVLPRAYELRRAVIHNDTNENNILVANQSVYGIIDFGDMCYSWLINELAVGLTYVLMRSDDHLKDAHTVVSAYNRILSLQSPELDVLYYLVAGRICISLCNSAQASLHQPKSEYVRISEIPARKLLQAWLAINPAQARAEFRKAAGMEPSSPLALSSYKKRRDSILSKAYSLSYQQPIVMEKAAFQYMYGHKGECFLDAYNNIMLVGHSHPGVVRAVSRQIGKLNTNTRYHYEQLLEYGELLLSYFPDPLSKVFFVNSGSAATDLALRIARFHTQKEKILCMDQGYHGNTLASIEVSPYKHSKQGIYPNAVIAPLPDWINSDFENEAAAASHFAKASRALIAEYPGQMAGCIAEPIMGCGGQLPLPAGYLSALYEAIRQEGGVCICDEVQIGFGRLGHHRWGFEMMGVVPDIVILGKPMGNGHPIGAVVTTRELAASFEQGPEFFSSFGGNPVSCAAGLAVLRVLKEEGLEQHAAETGDFLMGLLREIQAVDSRISDVRGSGLFLGVEFTSNDGKAGTRLASDLKNFLRQQHILVGTDGPFNSVLKIKPPLTFNHQNCHTLAAEIRRFLKKT